VRGGTSTDRPAINLIKAHAYGNDFLIVGEQELGPGRELPAFARRVCDRHRGVGADGLMVVQAESRRARMRLLNADGSPSEVSGNGVRCVAAWLALRGNHEFGTTFDIDTDAGTKHLRFLGRDEHRLTFVAEMGPPAELREVDLDVAGATVRAVVLRVGNPQCVVLGPATPERLRTIAAALAIHPFFPAGTNVELAEVVTPAEVRILIWERGVGPTESSGTGACAAAVAAAAYGGASRSTDIVSPGGRQHVEWTADGIQLTGWAEVLGEMAWRIA
jgi:diaminopimelate epimerase